MHRKLNKILITCISFLLIIEQSGFAQVAAQLDISTQMNALRGSLVQEKFRPLHLRYLAYDQQENTLRLFLDKGSSGDLNPAILKSNGRTILEYFFVGISLPNDAFWVNLRPDSPDNILDPLLEQTDVGKILLAADLQLKKDAAKFTSPETPQGKIYWNKLYAKAGELFTSENINVPTLTRPWIVPGEIIIRESRDNAYIYKATLKVMLEQDYLAGSALYNFQDERLKQINEYSAELMRELIIPKLTSEVNTARRYAALRQVYYSLILAQWFKSKFSGEKGTYPSLIDRRDLSGFASKEPWSKDAYFKEYQRSFKDGEYNINEPAYAPFGQTVRSYFSGGVALQGLGSQIISASGPLAFTPDYTVEMLCNGDPANPAIELQRFQYDANLARDIPASASGVPDKAMRRLSERMLQNLSAAEKDMLRRILALARRFRFQNIYLNLDNNNDPYSMGVRGQYFNHDTDRLNLYISRQFLADFTLFSGTVREDKIIDNCIKGILTHEFGHLIPEFNLDISPQKRELVANLLAFEPEQMSATMWYWLSRHSRYQDYSQDWLKQWALTYISHDPNNSGVVDESLQMMTGRIAQYESGYRESLLKVYQQRQERLRELRNTAGALSVLITDDNRLTGVWAPENRILPFSSEKGPGENPPVLKEAKTRAYLQALAACNGVVVAAAKALGVGRQTFYNILDRIPGMPRNGEISELGYDEKAALRKRKALELLGHPSDVKVVSRSDAEKQSILEALKATRGNKVEAATRLGIGRQTLYNKIKQYGIEPPAYYVSAAPGSPEAYSPPVFPSVIPSPAELEKEMIVFALQETAGDMSLSARKLGIGRQTLYNKCKEFGIEQDGFRSNTLHQVVPAEASRILSLDALEKVSVCLALLCYRGIRLKATEALGIGRQTLYNIIKRIDGVNSGTHFTPQSVAIMLSPYAKRSPAGCTWVIDKFITALGNDAPDISAELIALRVQFAGVYTVGPVVQEAESHAEALRVYSDEKLISESRALRGAMAGRGLDYKSIGLAVALFSESCRRIVAENDAGTGLVDPRIVSFIGGPPTERQIEAAFLLLKNRTIVGMLPSEGKTMAIVLGAYLSVLGGKRVEVHDWDSLLAARNAQICGAIINRLGLRSGVILGKGAYEFVARRAKAAAAERYLNLKNISQVRSAGDDSPQKTPHQKAFSELDVVYGSYGEMIFLWMNDWFFFGGERIHPTAMPQQVIVDEADTSLLESATEPLAFFRKLFQVREFRKQAYAGIFKFASRLREGAAYTIRRGEVKFILDEESLTADLFQALREGLVEDDSDNYARNLRDFMRGKDPYDLIKAAIEARRLYEKDEQYLVVAGRIAMRDENTGEIKPYTRWARGIHTFLEIKEHLVIQDESVIEGVMTTPEFYNGIPSFSAVIGTPDEEIHARLKQIYHADVRQLPAQYPVQSRHDLGPVYFLTTEEKHAYLLKVIEDIHKTGKPILINARSPKEAKAIYSLINPRGKNVPFAFEDSSLRLIDGSDEARDIWNWNRIGDAGSITIAAQIANRGVEIKLEDSLYSPAQTQLLGEISGLVVIITHHSILSTTEEQQKGRTARRGEGGVTLLLEDIRDNPLLARYVPDQLEAFLVKPFDPSDQTIPLLFDEARREYLKMWTHDHAKLNLLFHALVKVQFQFAEWSKETLPLERDARVSSFWFAAFVNNLYQVISRNEIGIFNRMLQNFDSTMERKRRSAAREPLTRDDMRAILFSDIAPEEEMLANSDPSAQEIRADGQTWREADKRAIPDREKPGGIDFRALPIATQPLIAPQFDAGIPQPARLGYNLDLDEELAQVKNLLGAGILPSVQRIKEYVQYCRAGENAGDGMVKILSCIADILRLEEERDVSTDPELRDMLVLLESAGPAGEMQIALSKIKISAKDEQSAGQ